MSLSITSADLLAAAGKASPPLAVTSAAAVGLTLNEWMIVCTIVYTILQAAILIYKFVRDFRKDAA
ncbi:hypothetical protein QUC32_23135 [Novosphingobium resinovorum]|uniref:hypothetical protein n=1 Tax=Novosphingobium TaxID=165696 RepID=UPI001B3C7C76|nr:MULTISPECIES: hypothetical protein [Novosphingobium]MBF7012546.1 hypothetical protein [Novosphingobium sp. HR1a]WJM27280.1 hypothetical protein QUC32_23135 [Novosphingobium resinovorum]